jgi:hypothetical protein
MNKDLYQQVLDWMADYEEPGLLEETFPDADIDKYLLRCAFDIFYDIHCDEMSKKWTEEDQLQNDGNEYWN